MTSTLPLPDISRAEVSIEVDLVNHWPRAVEGVLRGRFGSIPFEQKVSIAR